ncbi:MAG: hypothetical protein AAF702_13295 [Chloroflexota bacterium]
MPHPSQSLDWHVGEEQFLQNALVADTQTNRPVVTSHSQPERLLLYQILRGVAVIAVMFTAVASFSPHPELQTKMLEEQKQILEQQSIRDILALEGQLLAETSLGNSDALRELAIYDHSFVRSVAQKCCQGQMNNATASAEDHSLLLGRPDPSLFNSIEREKFLSVELYNALAVATVLVEDPADERWHYGTYRENRFYQMHGDVWGPAELTDTLLGETSWLETENLRFEFQAIEREQITAVAAKVDRAYVRLQQMLEINSPLEPTESDLRDGRRTKLTFISVPRDVTSQISVGLRQRISSPLAVRIPANYSDEEWLAQLMIERLVYMSVRSAVASKGEFYQYRWERVAWALNGWLQKELLGYRSPWHQEAAERFDSSSYQETAVYLGALLATDPNAWPKRSEMMHAYMLAESMIEYAIVTYGSDKIAPLAHGLGVYHTWANLIPAVFDTSTAEFEAGWNVYLVELAEARHRQRIENQIGAED